MAENALKKYNDKRNFEITQEPPGKISQKRKTGLVFTVQKHDATRQHYDFRLEWRGVLLSWAVPKGPSYCPKDKRLAVRTEDHPLSYHDFEGIIPAKQYGAGPVMLWDTGSWEPLDKDPAQALAQGKITFRLEGQKLKGEWTLVRMASKPKNRENWLLIKRNDATAIAKPDTGFLKTTDYSVKTGREFAEIAANVQTRNKHWLKSKCHQRQAFIICGFEPASTRDNAVGALHLGFYQQDELLYAGKVGTGFSHQIAFELFQKLQPLKITKPAFDNTPKGSFKTTQWVKPELLCEVQFAMWTKNGKVRHASFQGLRSDKKPQQISKEKPTRLAKRTGSKNPVKVAGVTISHADRHIFPEAKISKGELASFYDALSDQIMPSLSNRPLSVVRCPGGIDHQCFFQRSKGKGMPKHIHIIEITHNDKSHDYIYIKQLVGLIELVQMGSIEMHPWGVKIDNIEKPDKIVFDLDPDEGIPFKAVKLAALDVRSRLEDLGLESFLKCTGGKGLHITIPIQRRHDWDTVKNFARNFAKQMVDTEPQAYTINMAKKQRKGKIFIDYLRNDFAATAVMDYCVRARPGASVAVPLDWQELDALNAANQFSIRDVLDRQAANELFVYPGIRQSLTKQILSEVR